ncbi:hypothetical protein [Candidatus Ichthyocystis sparus]|uniref:hypothetical protein n=1 Tax=Candidatus Ichthyocystis sparus TaxID=1561004 RepID=UPI000B84CEA4|nr:hypothetical protein [Candidatus Ichthyocystis sparus]
MAVCREADLEKVKNKVEIIIKKLGVTGSLSSKKMMRASGELRKVVTEPRPENLQKMEKELTEVRARYEELERAGAGEAAVEMDCLRTKEIVVRADLGRAVARGIKVKGLEEELEVLVARKLHLEEMGSNEEELNEVRTREMEIGVGLARLRVMTVDERSLGLELDKLVAKRKEIEATVDMWIREIELNRLRKEAKEESSDRELELMLRLEYVEARVRVLELELGLWLGKIEAKRTDTGKGMTSLLGGSEISRAESSIAIPEVVSEVIVMQELEEVLVIEEGGVRGSNIGSIRVLEGGGASTAIAAEIEANGGDIVATTHSQVPDTPEQSTKDSDGGPTLAPDLVMGIIEAPTKKRKFLVESEEEENKKLARLAESKAVMGMKEREERERLRKREKNATNGRKKRQEKLSKKEEEVAVKSREEEIETVLSVAICRESDLEKVKDKLRGIMKRLEMPGPLSSRKRDIEMMKAKERELRGVIAEPRPENLRNMEKELAEVRARYKELEQAGAGEVSLNIDYLRIKETRVRADLERAVAREIKVKNLEKELDVLVARELDPEIMGASEEELGKIRTKKIKIGKDLAKLRATIAITEGSPELELKLGELIKERERIGATIDGVKRRIELNRLKEGAKSELGERELDMMLRLEGINVRVRVLELELGLWLGKIIAKKMETERVTTSMVPIGSEMVREDGKRATWQHT